MLALYVVRCTGGAGRGERDADFLRAQIVNPKGEMKGSAITGPVGKEAADLWPVCVALSNLGRWLTELTAYRLQLGRGDVDLPINVLYSFSAFCVFVRRGCPKIIPMARLEML